jgi:hypothetical protein
MGQNNSELLKYGFLRPYQPQQKKVDPVSERQENVRVIPRMERNNSVDYIRRRVDSNNSIDNSRRSRENSVQRETPK